MATRGFSSSFYGDGEDRTTDARSSQSTFYSDPAIAQSLAQSLSGLQQGLAGQYQGLLQNPTASPLYQGQLQGLLQSLLPSEARARTGLTDTFRAAGGLRSGAYGTSAAQLEGDILGRRQETAGRLLGQTFPQLMQALQNPLGQVSSLIDALKLSQAQGARTTTGGGGGGGFSSSFGSPHLTGSNTPGYFDTPGYGRGQVSPAGSTSGSTYGGTGYAAPAPNVSNTNAGASDLLSQLLGGSGFNTTYNPSTNYYESAPAQNLGTFSPQQGGPSYPAPTPEYDPISGAYQGGYQNDYASTNWEY